MRVAQAEKVFGALVSLVGLRRFSLSVTPVWSYVEYLPEFRVEDAFAAIRTWEAALGRAASSTEIHACEAGIERERRRIGEARRLGWMLRHLVARPLYRAAGLPMPDMPRDLMDAARAILPTLRPAGELGLYVGEALTELRRGTDIFLSLAPTGCMVTSMGEVLTPKLQMAGAGRIQSLFSADGDVDEDLLGLAILRAVGPARFAAGEHSVEGAA